MSTGNFWTMDEFDLIVFRTDYQGTLEDAKKAYQECKEYSDEDMEDISDNNIIEWANDDVQWDIEYTVKEIEKECEDFNDKLKFYKISVKSGYYSGFQLYAEEKGEWYCDYYGCVLASMQKKERRIINDWLNQIGIGFGGYKASIAYRFSNGETGYNLESCMEMMKNG